LGGCLTSFVFVTQLADKVREAERILGIDLGRISLELCEIQAVDVERVVAKEVTRALRHLAADP
jgi:hypothetical protein